VAFPAAARSMKGSPELSGREREAAAVIESRFPRFGVNKRRELLRLLSEISRREGISPERVLEGTHPRRFPELRAALVRRRYPGAAAAGPVPDPLLLPLERFPGAAVFAPGVSPSPRLIVWEGEVSGAPLLSRFRRAFPGARGMEVPSLREWRRSLPRRRPGPADYNRRRETVLIGSVGPGALQPCPCAAGALGCGYRVYELAAGCPYDCSYCFLQEYMTVPGLFFPVSALPPPGALGSFRRREEEIRIGTGEFSDSLAWDSLTGYARDLVGYFRGRKGIEFEFKTKSDEVEGLLGTDPGGNIVVGFSLSPPSAARRFDHGAAPVSGRLAAAARCAEAGYRLAFHFDPVVLLPGWEDGYRELIGEILERFHPDLIAWISLGTVRFRPRLLQILERRFPGDPIADQELFPGFDGKLRYLPAVRAAAYRRLLEFFGPSGRRLPIYLCMEDPDTWKAVGLDDPFAARRRRSG